ncbi:MAG: hypothetical protein JXA43_02175 [Candidatus Diapherotrites archaeon]|nr:hypothetical protein [Candidatus Diapherotrites archaeon]
MKEFTIKVENKSGSIHNLYDILAKSGINIDAISTHHDEKTAHVRLVTNDEETTREKLSKSGLTFSETTVLSVALNDRPGELSKKIKTLSAVGINVNSIYVLEKSKGVTTIALNVSDPEKAARLFS